MVPEMDRGMLLRSALAAPRPHQTLQKRIRDSTSIFHGFDIDFGRQFGDISKVLLPKMIILTCILEQFQL